MTTIPMKHQKQSQLEAVMEYLAQGKTLTALQALKYFGCMRLAAIIHVLRQEVDRVDALRREVGLHRAQRLQVAAAVALLLTHL